MKIKCLHGFFIFEETSIGQVSDFVRRFGFSIVPYAGRYTFESIAEAPNYSIKGKTILGNVALKNFEGEPWEVFEKNELVYDFLNDIVVPISSIIQETQVIQAGNRFVSPGLILPGSSTDAGRVKDYSAWYSRDTLRFLYSEVSYV